MIELVCQSCGQPFIPSREDLLRGPAWYRRCSACCQPRIGTTQPQAEGLRRARLTAPCHTFAAGTSTYQDERSAARITVAHVLRFRKPAPEAAASDAAVVARALQDRAAFGQLYDRYVDLIFHYCLVRLRDREEAEDATSLVFARALAALPTHRGRSFRSWLFTIAHNVVIDRQRAAIPVAPLSLLEAVPAPDPSLEDQVATTDRRRAVAQAVSQLPDEQRAVVELRLAGLTGPEVAAALGRSHESVRTTQRRAIARLRSLLGIGPEREERRDVS